MSSVSCCTAQPYASSFLTSKAVSQLSLVAFSLEFVTEATQAVSTVCSLVWGSLSSVELLRGWVYWSVALALQTIREVQPDVVVVELCQYRVSMLKMDEKTLLREAKEVSLEKLQQAVRQVRSRPEAAALPCRAQSVRLGQPPGHCGRTLVTSLLTRRRTG